MSIYLLLKFIDERHLLTELVETKIAELGVDIPVLRTSSAAQHGVGVEIVQTIAVSSSRQVRVLIR